MDLFKPNVHVEISPAGVRRIRQGHLWVYSSDVVRDLDNPGTPLVRVHDSTQKLLGYAFHSPSSQIRLRMFSHGPEPPTIELLRARLETAIRRRRIEPG